MTQRLSPLAQHAGLLALVALTSPSLAQPNDENPIFFGDLHVHTRLSLDAFIAGGTRAGPADACDYARYQADLNFVGIADHGEFLGRAEWRSYVSVIDGLNDELDPSVDGTPRFVTLLGYEWTSLQYGHKNVFFRTSTVPPDCWDAANFAQALDTAAPDELWAALRAWRARAGSGADFLSIPHHTASGALPTDLSFRDPDAQPLVEVFSKHGSSEGDASFQPVDDLQADSTYQAALAMWLSNRDPGYQLGAIASTDSHDGETMAAGAPRPEDLAFGENGILQPRLYTTGGIAGVHADELTRAHLFDALKARRCYGTSGPKIRLWLHASSDRQPDPSPMGASVTFERSVTLFVRALGETAPIVEVEILRNNEVMVRLQPDPEGRVRWTDAAPRSPAFYTVRALQAPTRDYQVRRLGTTRAARAVQLQERAWSSPVWALREGS